MLARNLPRVRLRLPAWIDSALDLGIVSRDPEVRQRERFTNIGVAMMFVANFAHSVQNYFYDPQGLMPIIVYGFVMMGLFAFTPALYRFGENVGAFWFACVAAIGNLFVIWSIGVEGGAHFYYALAGGGVLLLGVHRWRWVVTLFVMVFVLLIASINFAPHYGPVMADDSEFHELLSGQIAVNITIVYCLLMVYALSALRKAERALEAEHERAETLLTTIMPERVAERLKREPDRTIADRRETVAVLFSDIVGFTPAARALPPEDVVEALDRLVRAFDRLAVEHGVEKIKTIGDAYMAAAGLYGETGEEAARRIASFAIAMMEEIDNQPPLGPSDLSLRCGLHIGPAIAGVIGQRRYSFDIWGDAVNVAARMESHGLPGRIHVTRAFCDVAGGCFSFEERGMMTVKGIGEMETAFLVRRLPVTV